MLDLQLITQAPKAGMRSRILGPVTPGCPQREEISKQWRGMNNINRGFLDWTVIEEEKDSQEFNEEKGKAPKETPITRTESASYY